MKDFQIGSRLNGEQVDFFRIFARDCRAMILEMLRIPQSGHPGGSLSSIDFLSLLYAGIISRTGEKVVISNGHISPAVYSVFAELGWVNRQKLVTEFRKAGSVFEGHVSRKVAGVEYGTGPLGIGVGVAAGMAWAEKYKRTGQFVFAVMGDGETQEGEVYEMMNFASAAKLDNLIVICDFNEVQLSGAIGEIMPNNMIGHFLAAGWRVLEVQGHDFRKLWKILGKARQSKGKPVLIVAKTVMGKGVDFMEIEGRAKRSTWHGKAPNAVQIDEAVVELALSRGEQQQLENFRKSVVFNPNKVKPKKQTALKPGSPIIYDVNELTDCRTAYGRALLDLAQKNKSIIALTADLRESVKTGLMAAKYPDRHIECGIAEQLLVSVAGGLSLSGLLPFVSSYAVFLASRAKDQIRVNDLNETNVKMVVTHAGLSVGEDGPTHHSLDDHGAMLALFNTKTLEPADPNQTDRMVRFLATEPGNFYLRMGRHRLPIVTDLKGQAFYGKEYKYRYGRSDLLRRGSRLTVIAIGVAVHEALEAWEKMREIGKPFDLVAVTSIKRFDKVLFASMLRNKNVITVEDHNPACGLYSQIAQLIQEKAMSVRLLKGLGVREYQDSGDYRQLYFRAGIKAENLVKYIQKVNK